MIGWLKGHIIEKQAPELLLNVGGVGYEIQAPMSTFYHLPASGEIELYTHFVVREDAQLLFGFASKDERRLFRSIIKVNGIGPKLGLTILSTLEPSRFVQCVQDQDVSALTKVPGIGKKTAERLLIEMRDKLKDWHLEADALNIDVEAPQAMQVNNTSLVNAEAESALVALGYKPAEATKMIHAALKDNEGLDSAEALIRASLKRIGGK